MTPSLLKELQIDSRDRSALISDYDRFTDGLPDRLEEFVRDHYKLDLTSEYGGLPVKNPFGKGSGQLSLNTSQVRRDAEDGLGFVVLKTIIAQDADGTQAMSEWAIPETRMLAEPIKGRDGTDGWTVTWKGRGWYDTFEKYLEFFGEALQAGAPHRMPAVPSCKYHLPKPGESQWKIGEYKYTTGQLLKVWQRNSPFNGDMPIEKDFSPTLAGSDRAAQGPLVIEWLTRVTQYIRTAVAPHTINVGLKVFNAIFDDDFQFEMLRSINEQCEGEALPDFLVYANRLFDPHREFDGVRGIAYGGPDLTTRNLSILARMRSMEHLGQLKVCRLPISATGNIVTGRIAAEYLIRGCSTFQIHTFFQLPSTEYRMRSRSKTVRALHELYFHPEEGLIAWLLHLRRLFGWPVEWNMKQMAQFCVEPANNVWAQQASVLS